MEGCGYRDLQGDFDAAGVNIVGVSFDSPEDNQEWAEDEGFDFDLWTDEDRVMALYYGAASSESQAWADRITLLLDADGTVQLVYDVGFEIGAHPAQVLEDAEKMFD